jgi:hypothetical protein
LDTAILIFCVVGALMFIAYVFFIIKTSYDDEKKKKQQNTQSNGKG